MKKCSDFEDKDSFYFKVCWLVPKGFWISICCLCRIIDRDVMSIQDHLNE